MTGCSGLPGFPVLAPMSHILWNSSVSGNQDNRPPNPEAMFWFMSLPQGHDWFSHDVHLCQTGQIPFSVRWVLNVGLRETLRPALLAAEWCETQPSEQFSNDCTLKASGTLQNILLSRPWPPNTDLICLGWAWVWYFKKVLSDDCNE